MIQVGIFTGYFPYGLEETATKIRKHGFNTVQLDMSFKDMDLETSKISKAKCKKIRDTFRAHNLPVCAVSGYTNIVHPDPTARAQKLKHLKTLIRNARDLGWSWNDIAIRPLRRSGDSAQKSTSQRLYASRPASPSSRLADAAA